MKRMSYSGTTISPERTQADIDKLLKDFGIEDRGWVTFKGETTLAFVLRYEFSGVERAIRFTFKPPRIEKKVRQYNQDHGRYERITINDDRVAYRMLLHYLKNKLLAVKNGMVTIEEEFMPYITTSLPNGQETRLGDRLQKMIETGKVEQFLSLESKPEPNRRVIEVQSEEKGEG